jgi:hypothetical protein
MISPLGPIRVGGESGLGLVQMIALSDSMSFVPRLGSFETMFTPPRMTAIEVPSLDMNRSTVNFGPP